MAEAQAELTLAGPLLTLVLSLEAPGTVRDLRDRRTGRSLLAAPSALVGGVAGTVGGLAVAAPRAVVQGEAGVRLEWEGAGGLTLAVDAEGLRWCWEGTGRVWFPFLAALAAGASARRWRPLTTADGRQHYRRAAWPLPLVAEGPGGRCATVLLDPGEARSGLQTLDLLASPGLPSPVSGLLAVHDGGWPAAFDRYRRRLRLTLDLTVSVRDDLSWLRRTLVHRLVFLYGAEVADPLTGRPDAERLLAGNHELGGVDAVLLWLAYPRLGVDRRTQWDLYDDLPGGRAGLRALARALQARGTRVFVPYKPWDRDAELRGAPVADDAAELARLVADVGADGVFLDTLGAAAPALRAALDAVAPGIAMVGENRATGSGFATVGGSWDQPPSRDLVAGDWSAPDEVLPSVDLGRFVVPEHPLFAVNRHTGGPARERTLLRGLFGGTGFMVWQDVFGLMLPYTPAETRLLRRCARVLRGGADAFSGAAPTPLVDTLDPRVAANAYAGVPGRLWTLCNAGDSGVDAPVLEVEPAPGHRLVDVWHQRPLPPDGSVSVPAGGVAVVAELPLPEHTGDRR